MSSSFVTPIDCSLQGSSVHGISQATNTGVGYHFLLQGVFPTQELNPCLLLGRWIPYHWATWEALHYNVCAKSLQSYPTLCHHKDRRLSGSSVYGILQARILEWVSMPYSRGSFQPKDQTCVSSVSCVGRWILYHWHHLYILNVSDSFYLKSGQLNIKSIKSFIIESLNNLLYYYILR